MKIFHRHDWNTTAVQRGTLKRAGGDATLVLQRCRSDAARTRMFEGHWTAAELRGLR